MFAVIMAGGRGTRFWPRSRKRRPKQLLNIIGEKTILEQTVDRIRPLCDWDRILIVTEAEQAPLVRELLPGLPADQLLVEPLGKNTAPCVGLAALFVAERDPAEAMVILPADHHIADIQDFQATLQRRRSSGPRGRCAGHAGDPPHLPGNRLRLYRTRGADEDPAALAASGGSRPFTKNRTVKKAETMLAAGRFLLEQRDVYLDRGHDLKQIARWTPALYRELQGLKNPWSHPGWEKALREAYERMDDISIDYAVMEKADNVRMIEGRFGWNDVGSWEAVLSIV